MIFLLTFVVAACGSAERVSAPSTTEASVSTTTTSTTTVAPTTTEVDEVDEVDEIPTESPATTTLPPPTTVAPTTTTTVSPVPTTTQAPVPTTTVPPTEPLEVSTDSLPQARIGDDYGAELTATGGAPPYKWSLVQGFLPVGLEVSVGGFISGVPTERADTSLVFQVSDSEGQLVNSTELAFTTATNRRAVVARGGTVFIDNEGDSVELFLVSPSAGYSAVIVEPGGFRVEVQFVPLQGDQTSWVVCEINEGVVCTSG